MTLEEYFQLPEVQADPETPRHRDGGLLHRGAGLHPGVIREGMLLFTAETASSWGGPFPGNAAHFMLLDQRTWSNKRSGRPFADAHQAALARINQPGYRCRNRTQLREELERGNPDVVHQFEECGTREYPIRIWVMGNDDTSYSKWFKTVEEAEALLTLLEGAGPLDYNKDFHAYEWTFTN